MLFKSLIGLAAIAAASPIATDDYIKALEIRAGGMLISDADFNNIRFYAQHAAAAYCNFNAAPGKSVECKSSACPLVEQNKPTVVASMAGKLTGIGAYVATDSLRREVVLSVRGSNNIRNYITDVVFAWRDFDLTDQCKVHTGFSHAWDEIKDVATSAMKTAHQKYPGYKLIITGHSLGGAVANLGAAYLRRDGLTVDLYTYGAPRVGNDKFANWFSGKTGGQWRITHENDPVPRLPPIFTGYHHVTPEYWLSGGRSHTIDYMASQVTVCQGISNTKCNASRWITDIIAHLYYLGSTSGCSGFPLQLRGDPEQDPLPQDLKDRLTAWSQKDQQFVKDMEAKKLAGRDDSS